MGLNHTSAMLRPEGLKTFVLSHRNSFPNISTRSSVLRNLLSMADVGAAQIKPLCPAEELKARFSSVCMFCFSF